MISDRTHQVAEFNKTVHSEFTNEAPKPPGSKKKKAKKK